MRASVAPIAAMALLAAACTAVTVFPSDTMDQQTFERELARNFQYPPPAGEPAELKDAAAGQAADAAYFDAFPRYDRAYSPVARASAQQLADALKVNAANLSHEQFVMRIAEIAALADNGHTSIDQNALMKNTPRLPLRTYLFSDGLFVLRASQLNADLLGARIDSIDGTPVPYVFGAIRKYAGGTESRRKRQLLPVLESPGLLQAAGVARDGTALTYSGLLADGRPFTRRIEAEKRGPAAPVMNTARLLYPAPADAALRSFLPDSAGPPLSLTHQSELFWTAPIGAGLYIDVTYNNDTDDTPLETFLASALDRVRQQRPPFVILDMRMNGGGDYTKSYAFARALPVETKRVYVLTSPITFSAAITTVAALKEVGGSKVTIVGEPVGDRLDFWAEGGAFTLPNSMVRVYYTAGRHKYDGPCNDPGSCFWLNRRYPVSVKTVAPDIPVPSTFAAYRSGRDAALDAVLAHESR